MNEEAMVHLALKCGFSAAAVIQTDQIAFDAAFRPYCEENLCGNYGANYSCPPDCGSPEEMERRLRGYRHALVFQSKWPISDYSDAAAIRHAKRSHNEGMLRAIEALEREDVRGLMCGASNCTLCERCAIRDGEPCKDPDHRFSCLSAYCIYVKKLADVCGMEYACQDGSLAFFGLYAF